MRRFGMQVGRRHLDHLGVGAVDGQAEDVECASLRAFVPSPIERRIDYDLAPLPGGIDARADGGDLARAVRSEDDGNLDACVLAFANPDVATIQRRRTKPDDRLA